MGKKLEVFDPSTGEKAGELTFTDDAGMEEMVMKACEAENDWAETPMYERTALMEKFLSLLTDNAEDLAVTLTKEMAKPILQSRGEINSAIPMVKGFVQKANHLYGEVIPTDSQKGLDKDFIFTRREPLGVIACIVPFNYPVDLCLHKAVPALMMGNTVIIKAPTKNPLAVMRVTELFREAGFPEGTVQGTVCSRDISNKYLTGGRYVDAVSLTGSTKTGVDMLERGAESMKYIFLELGGNDATIVRSDADIDYAVEEVSSGRIVNAGQTCCGCKRVIVQEDILAEFTEKLVDKFKGLKRGPAMDESTEISCLVSEADAVKVKGQIDTALEQGAKCLAGGGRQGAFIEPTVLGGVTEDMDIAGDMEIFGPVLPIISYKTDEDAVRIINRPQYGLSSGIITKDLAQAMRMARRIESGAVVLNGQCNYRHMEQGFGGYKMTGHAREGISTTLEEHSKTKHYIVKGLWK